MNHKHYFALVPVVAVVVVLRVVGVVGVALVVLEVVVSIHGCGEGVPRKCIVPIHPRLWRVCNYIVTACVPILFAVLA